MNRMRLIGKFQSESRPSHHTEQRTEYPCNEHETPQNGSLFARNYVSTAINKIGIETLAAIPQCLEASQGVVVDQPIGSPQPPFDKEVTGPGGRSRIRFGKSAGRRGALAKCTFQERERGFSDALVSARLTKTLFAVSRFCIV